MIRPIHPFPARMAPELVLSTLARVKSHVRVLDPMAGSGTVLRAASEHGHSTLGFDLDPLAVLIARVWTTPVKDKAIEIMGTKLLSSVKNMPLKDARPSWQDDETTAFVDYWFGEPQKRELQRLANGISHLQRDCKTAINRAAVNCLKVALSRIIITKANGASLARDISHSRPHRVMTESDYSVLAGFERSLAFLRRRLHDQPPQGSSSVELGDARALKKVENESIDLVITSPPYLNAIDYMRGHRLALVWLGHPLRDLRAIRSSSIGAERGPDDFGHSGLFENISSAMCDIDRLPTRHRGMVLRFSEDLYRMLSEIARALRPSGKVVLIMGNSCLRDTFIHNSAGTIAAAKMVGLRLRRQSERNLPSGSRYLPTPNVNSDPFVKRMRTETVLSFSKV